MDQYSPLLSRLETTLNLIAYHADHRILRRRGQRLARFVNRNGQNFIRPEIGDRNAFLHRLARHGIRYVALGGVPATAALDLTGRLVLLVHDEDVGRIREFITYWPTGEPCDLYSPGGLPGFSYGDIPLFPPKLAQRLLADATAVDGVSTPGARSHFFSAVYREIYLSGFAAGIPSTFGHENIIAESGRADLLKRYARQIGVGLKGSVTLEALDEFLATHGWRPPIDLLERLACSNSWLARKLESEGHRPGAEPPGLAVFYIRQRAVDLNMTSTIIETLLGQGFRLMPVPGLSSTQLQDAAAEVRGGNWSCGPWPVSGGDPGLILVGFDPSPIAPEPAALKEFPLLDNLRIRAAKQAVRDAVGARVPPSGRFNPMHSTDNAVQAWRAVRLHFPASEADLRTAVASIR